MVAPNDTTVAEAVAASEGKDRATVKDTPLVVIGENINTTRRVRADSKNIVRQDGQGLLALSGSRRLRRAARCHGAVARGREEDRHDADRPHRSGRPQPGSPLPEVGNPVPSERGRSHHRSLCRRALGLSRRAPRVHALDGQDRADDLSRRGLRHRLFRSGNHQGRTGDLRLFPFSPGDQLGEPGAG